MTWEPESFALIWGSLGVKYSMIYFILAFALAYGLCAWQLLRAGGVVDEAVELVSLTVLGAVAGGRLSAILVHDGSRLMAGDFQVILRGGFELHGAMLGLCLALYLYGRFKGVSFSELGDRFSFSAAAAAVLLSMVQLFSSQGVGKTSNVPWAMRFPRYDWGNDMHAPLRHPVQLYELAVGLLVLLGLVFVDRKLGKENRTRGVLAGGFALCYFGGRVVLDPFTEKAEQWTSAGLSLGGLCSLVFAGLGAALLARSMRRRAPALFAPVRSAESAESA